MQTVFRGVKNISVKNRSLMFDSTTWDFAPGEVHILPEDAALHAYKLQLHHTVNEKTGERGYFGSGAPFVEIPLAEALKVAKFDENKSLRRAKDEAEAQALKEKQLRDKIVAEVRAELREAAAVAPVAQAVAPKQAVGAK